MKQGISAILFALVLSSCGVKGDLYLPDDSSKKFAETNQSSE